MANKAIRGITVEIGGDTTKLGKALEGSEKQTRSLQAELRDVEKLLKFDPTNTELLAQKQKILADMVSETTKKLDTMKEAEAQVVAQFERGEIAEDQLRAFQRELIKTESELDDLESQLKDAGDASTDLGDDVKDAGDAAEQGSDGFTVMKGALADFTANAIQSAISAIGDLIGSLFDLSEATEEYRTMQAKLEGSANTFGYTADFAKSKYEEFYKYLGDDQAATNAITNLMGVGTSTESLSKLVEGATGAWATYGDSINVESLTEAINETVTCGKVTGSFADTINWCKDANDNLKTALGGNKDAQKAYNDALKEGLPVEDAFNEALAKITDEQERADVVAQFLNSTYGESKKTYDELNGSIVEANEAELELKETQAQLGETMQPVNTAFTNLKNQALEAILPLVKKVAEAFLDLLNWLKEHPTAAKVLTAIVIGLAAAFGVLATALAIQGIITGVTKAIAFLNTTLLANPIVLIIAAIAALVAAFVYLWNNCEGFRQFWIKLWEGIKSACKVALDAIVSFFKSAWSAIKSAWSAVKQWFSDLWTGIKNVFSAVGTWFGNIFRGAWNGIKSAWSGAKSWFSNLWSGVKNVFSGVSSWFGNIFRNAWAAVKRVFSNWGSFFGGLWTTIKNKFSSIGTSIANAIGGAVKSGINGVISRIESTINGGIRLINGAISLINEIPGVSIGKFREVSFPRLARGGIVDRPTFAEIGENGAEAIIPLENNTGWLRGVARELNTQLSAQPSANNGAVLEKLNGIYDRLGRLQMVLDSGTLVGELIDEIDAGLADKQLLSARGV